MRAFVAVLAAGLTLAACGSSSDTKSGAPASGGASATVTDTVSTAMAPVQKFAAPGAAVKAPAGKHVVAITCSSQGYGCVQGGIGVQEAGKVLGWNVTVADGKGDPATWNSAIQQAVTAKADGIVLLAVDPQLVAGALAKAKAAGIPVVSTFIPKLGSATVDGYASTDHALGGKILADWIIKDSGGKAKVLMLDEKAFPELVKRNTALVDELKAACAGCTVSDTVEFNIGTMAQQLAGAVTSSLQRHPDVQYVVAPFDSSGIFAGQGIRSAGKAGTVKMVGAEGDPNGIQGVQSGGQAVDLATVPPWGGWAAVDLLVRHMAGSPVENAVLPQRLFDKSNVPSGKGWTGDVDYQSAYRELWGR
ncbi:MAG TPA: substrate-binding domain-containing protein [Solirubrobacter sp.]